jgi:hypothetical protein
MATVEFLPADVSITFDTAAALALAEQIAAAEAADTAATALVITTSETTSTDDAFVLITATGADTVTGSGTQSVAGGDGGLTYSNTGAGSVAVALDGGNNSLTFGAGVTATVATGSGSDTVTAAGSGSFNVGAGTNIVDLTGDASAVDTVTAAGTGDEFSLGAATATVSESGSNAIITAGSGSATINDGGTGDTIFGGAGAITVNESGVNNTIVVGVGGATVFGSAGTSLQINGASDDASATVVLGGGTETIDASGSAGPTDIFATSGGDDTITLGAGYGFVSVQGGQVTVNAGTGATYFVDTATSMPSAETINDLGAADALALYGATSVASIVANAVVSDGNMTLTLAPGDTLTLVGVTDLTGYIVDPDQGPIPICYLAGTRILTPTGERRIEDLRVGDRVVTRFSGFQPIKWIGRQSYGARVMPENLPVRISAGALGEALPARDLFVSPGHSMLVGDTLVLARNLVNGVTITQPPDRREGKLEYFQIELDRHDCVIAEGAFSETFADAPGLRAGFHNEPEFWALYPDHCPVEELKLCAPRPEKGVTLWRALRPIVARAGAGREPGPLSGFIERAEGSRLEGWAIDPTRGDLPVMLDIVFEGKLIATALAADYRPDLVEVGTGRGCCSFGLNLPIRLTPDRLPRLSVRRHEDGAELPHLAPKTQAVNHKPSLRLVS